MHPIRPIPSVRPACAQPERLSEEYAPWWVVPWGPRVFSQAGNQHLKRAGIEHEWRIVGVCDCQVKNGFAPDRETAQGACERDGKSGSRGDAALNGMHDRWRVKRPTTDEELNQDDPSKAWNPAMHSAGLPAWRVMCLTLSIHEPCDGAADSA